MHVDGDAAAVVGDGDRVVGVDDDLDLVGLAGQRLVDGVVDDLVDQVVQAARAGRADVHARALADRLEALEDGDVLGAVAPVAPALAGACRPVSSLSAKPSLPSSHHAVRATPALREKPRPRGSRARTGALHKTALMLAGYPPSRTAPNVTKCPQIATKRHERPLQRQDPPRRLTVRRRTDDEAQPLHSRGLAGVRQVRRSAAPRGPAPSSSSSCAQTADSQATVTVAPALGRRAWRPSASAGPDDLRPDGLDRGEEARRAAPRRAPRRGRRRAAAEPSRLTRVTAPRTHRPAGHPDQLAPRRARHVVRLGGGHDRLAAGAQQLGQQLAAARRRAPTSRRRAASAAARPRRAASSSRSANSSASSAAALLALRAVGAQRRAVRAAAAARRGAARAR